MNTLSKIANIKNVTVEQFHNKNQFLIDLGGLICLQSYQSLVIVFDYETKNLYLGKDWDYSNTTRKHIYMFIQEYYPEFYNVFLANAKNKRAVLLKILKDKFSCLYELED